MFGKIHRKDCLSIEARLIFECEQLEERAMLAVSAVFIPTTGNMFITGDATADTIILSRVFRGQILLNGSQVSTATVFNTRSIAINAGGGNDTITIDQTTGTFGPGVGNEPGIREIEIFVNGQAGEDRLEIIGQIGDDTIDLGQVGINLNNDNDVDVTVSSIELVLVDGRNGSDTISAGGNAVVGEAFSQRLDLGGGNGNDTLIGGTANDILRGQVGDDALSGGVNNDMLFGGIGNDVLRKDRILRPCRG